METVDGDQIELNLESISQAVYESLDDEIKSQGYPVIWEEED